jgi:hypothetical protein
MTPYYSAWQANEAQGTAVVMLLAGLALLMVIGWQLIPIILPQRFITWCRWGYVAWVVLASVLLVAWRMA